MFVRALLLAAGEGRRLRPLTDNLPKPMLPVGGIPVLEHNVRLLAASGIYDIVINTHHLPERIVEHFGDGSRFGCKIVYSFERQLLGTAGAVRGALKQGTAFGERFVVMYGDNLTDCRLSRVLHQHEEKRATGTIALYQRENVLASGIVGIDSDDRVTRFLEKPQEHEVFSHWVNAGILIFERKVLEYIPDGVSDFGRDVLPPMVAAGERVFGYRMSERLWWIDSLADYEATKRDFQDDNTNQETQCE